MTTLQTSLKWWTLEEIESNAIKSWSPSAATFLSHLIDRAQRPNHHLHPVCPDRQSHSSEEDIITLLLTKYWPVGSHHPIFLRWATPVCPPWCRPALRPPRWEQSYICNQSSQLTLAMNSSATSLHLVFTNFSSTLSLLGTSKATLSMHHEEKNPKMLQLYIFMLTPHNAW